MFKWAQKIKSAVKRTKLSELDDNDSEYLDIDNLLSLFLEEFKTAKKMFSKILNKQFGRVIQTNDRQNDITLDNMQETFKECKKCK
jgi:hypothetical protein